ncbi:Serine/threonine-protein kinase PrkC [Paenibacillus plantiphilus]|uniref:Serine/threonine-protein kinase PrkC n=1 Tax=Paenibacillus plantiphilus TaxID=2905650 RepID=A0ABM9C5W9_9BACL|nr:serine/threonine-protein kinase [Paenibacillus plantiphilus]CAH1202658.1 Serine/threonine-protein kinase PrkC [Paenibacillus plantiphilus]
MMLRNFYDEYELLEPIDGGESAEEYYTSVLWYGASKADEQEVAIKQILLRDSFDLRERREIRRLQNQFREEMRTLKLLQGTNGVVQLVDYFEIELEIIIVLEKAAGLPLNRYMRERGLFTVDKLFRIGQRLAAILQDIHHKQIIHRDLTASNIFIDEGDCVTVIDFGQAYRISGVMERGAGTRGYMPPEAYQLKHKPRAAYDVFSFGILLFIMLEGRLPYHQEQINSGTAPALQFVTSSPPAALEQLIRRCIQIDRLQRPSVTEIRYQLQRMEEHYERCR